MPIRQMVNTVTELPAGPKRNAPQMKNGSVTAGTWMNSGAISPNTT